MSLIGTKLYTWWKGKLVGKDQFGNRYFREKGGRKRWVIYNGVAEASKVPPEWHAWLHYTTDEAPLGGVERKPWQKEHVPNLSGTPFAYRPAGSVAKGGHRPPATGDYEAWQPE
ncbi:MAG TPA: NADH:ubiquinone oxidoreductase subunit NDUFA12 [Ferrovibrio sp.]|uniref:NADH:ubiquinone oxidoreductase subunit NDUFA12 n=1 Tax=Ferrovibrio sp. TaxID=1917215 RepID=UPI002ED188BA